jgi:hypothetical protein
VKHDTDRLECVVVFGILIQNDLELLWWIDDHSDSLFVVECIKK